MKLRNIIFVLCAALAIVACDDTTTTLGSSLTDDMDHLEISANSFNVSSSSLYVDSVYARNTNCYLGAIRDPETRDYISCSLMTQFHTLENYEFPEKDKFESLNENGEVIADSVEMRLFFDDFYGDSCVAMKLKVSELDHAMPETERYYSNFNPAEEGYVRDGGLQVSKNYSLTDMNVDRNIRDNSDYTKNIRINLDKKYTDKNGKEYNNFGSFVINKYFENPEYFKNSYNMTKDVLPGFFIESTGGLGCMAYIKLCQLNIYFRYKTTINKKDTVVVGTSSFSGTEEVLTTSTIYNDKTKLKELEADENCTYLKTPGGIFTELTLPVEEICKGHDNDTINTASITLTRINNNEQNKYSFDIPETIIMVPKDDLFSFFENKYIANYKTSFISTYSKSDNTYVFSNIGSLIRAMYDARKGGERSENWNKVVLVPITATYTTLNQTTYLTRVVNDMSFTSTRLLRGTEDNGAIKVNVIYSKYK